MARLPIVGGDEGNWGTILNDYLSQQHGAGGEHLAITIPDTTQASTGIVLGVDTNLYRSAANILRTDDSFTVGSILTSQILRVTGASPGNSRIGSSVADSGAELTISPQATTTKPLVIRGLVSQSANLQEWQNNVGTNLTYIDSSGRLIANQGVTPTGTLGSVTALPTSAGAVPIVARGIASQTGDLQQWQNSAGTLLSRVASDGSITTFSGGTTSAVNLAPGPSPTYRVNIQTLAAGTVGALIQGAASQSANLQEWKNSSGTNLVTLAADGTTTLTASGGYLYKVGTGATTSAFATAVSGDIEQRFRISADGKQQWGPGNATFDTNLYRGTANQLRTDDAIAANLALLARYTQAGQVEVGADTNVPTIIFGQGASADTNLYRSAANNLTTDDTFNAAAFVSIGEVYARNGAAGKVKMGNAGPSSEAGLVLGSAEDTNLYRSATDTLTTDDVFIASNYKRGTGSPESVVTGSVGDLYLRTDGSSGTTLYVKESGSATNTGWVAINVGNTAGHTLKEGGTPLTQRAGMNFTADDFDLADDAVNSETDVSLSSNVARKFIDNSFSASQSITNAGGKTTLALTNSGADTGLTIGGDTNLYRSATNTLKTDDNFQANSITATSGGGGFALPASGYGNSWAVDTSTWNATFRGTMAGGNDYFKLQSLGTSDADAYFEIATGDNGNEPIVFSQYSGATPAERLRIHSDGKIYVGSSQDTNLYRSAADTLRTDDTFIALKGAFGSGSTGVGTIRAINVSDADVGILVRGTASQSGDLQQWQRSNGTDLLKVTSNGALVFDADTNLYRSAANTLATDDVFTANNYKRGTGSPEGAVTGSVGDLYLRTDGGASTTLYVKESGSAINTGWVALGAAESGVYVETFGDATNTSYTITHNLGSKDVFVGVYQISDGAEIDADITRATVNTVTIGFASAPGINTMRVIVAGAFDDAAAGGGGQPSFPVTQDSANAATDDFLRAKLTADTQYRFVANSNGALEWGPGGSTAPDTNLYRSAVNTLKTDDSLEVTGNISAGNITATPTADSIVKANGTGKLAAGWLQEVLGISDLSNVTISSPASGQVLKYNGGAWVEDYLTETVIFSETDILVTKTGKHRFYVEDSYTIVAVRASVGTAPTGSSIIIDVNRSTGGGGATTIFTTQSNRPTIAVSTNTATAAAIDQSSLIAGDYLTVDIDQVGSGTAGSDLTVQIVLRSAG